MSRRTGGFKTAICIHRSPLNMRIFTEEDITERTENEDTAMSAGANANALPQDCIQYAVPKVQESPSEQEVEKTELPKKWMIMKY